MLNPTGALLRIHRIHESERYNLQAIWFSASGDLSEDARRDFRDVGALKYESMRIHNLKKLKPGKKGLAALPGNA